MRHFHGRPAQIGFISKDPGGLLYFTADEVSKCGVHACQQDRTYLTIFESNETYYSSKTTGLAFSPDKKHMYVLAYQSQGHVWEVTQDDGLPFGGTSVDIKYCIETHRVEN